jgi:hypothetical protein
MKVRDIDYEFSVKLGDPVEDNGEGESFSKIDRINYLRNGWSRLSRLLRVLMRDYQPEFNKQRAIYSVENLEKQKWSFSLPPYIQIDEVFLTASYTEAGKTGLVTKTKQCSKFPATTFLSKKNGVNDVSIPRWEDEQYYYTVINNEIVFLPQGSNGQIKSFEMVYLPDIVKWEDDSEIPITREYLDLLLDLSAIFGMQDIARLDKVNTITASAYDNLKILAQWATARKASEGVME